MKSKIFSSLIFFLLQIFNNGDSFASDPIPARPQDHPMAFVGCTVHTVTDGILKQGTIIFDKGKIIAIGQNLAIPPGIEIVDLADLHIYPGLIDAYTCIGLTEIGAVPVTVDVTEKGDINPNMRAEAVINPESEIIPVTRANGITHVVSTPKGGLIAGTAALIKLDGWTWEDMILVAPLGLYVEWPEMTTSRSPWIRISEEEQRKRRDQQLKKLRDAFVRARAYMTAKQAAASGFAVTPAVDLRWEAMMPVLAKKIPVFILADEIQQINAAIAFAAQESLRVIIVGGQDAWRTTGLLKKLEIPVIVTCTLSLPMREWEGYDQAFAVAGRLFTAGVQFCIAGNGGASNERNLPYHAAMAAAFGLPPEEALKAITLYPAQILGVADRLGSLQPGKEATFLITNGDPLQIETQVLRVFIQGSEIDLRNKHRTLYEKYREKYRRLTKE